MKPPCFIYCSRCINSSRYKFPISNFYVEYVVPKWYSIRNAYSNNENELIQQVWYFRMRFSILVRCAMKVSELWNSSIAIDCYLVSTLLRTVLKVQVNNFQKVPLVYHFIKEFDRLFLKFVYYKKATKF